MSEQQKVTVDRRDSSFEDSIHVRYSADLAIYTDDVKEVRERLLQKGYEVSHREASDLWGGFSGWMCASWLIVDDRMFELFLERLEEVSDEEQSV